MVRKKKKGGNDSRLFPSKLRRGVYAFFLRRTRPMSPTPRSVSVAGSGTAAVNTRAGSLLRRPTVPVGPVLHVARSWLKKVLKRRSRCSDAPASPRTVPGSDESIRNQLPFKMLVQGKAGRLR